METKERRVGTVSRGIRCPIIREGDDLAKIVTESVLAAAESDGFELRDRDVIAMTESIVARSQGNYATVNDIAADVKAKLGGETVGVIFPILSRNRFAICLRGIAKGAKKIVLMLSYPSDEVGTRFCQSTRSTSRASTPTATCSRSSATASCSANRYMSSPASTMSNTTAISSNPAARRLRLSSQISRRLYSTTPTTSSTATYTPVSALSAFCSKPARRSYAVLTRS